MEQVDEIERSRPHVSRIRRGFLTWLYGKNYDDPYRVPEPTVAFGMTTPACQRRDKPPTVTPPKTPEQIEDTNKS